MAQTLASVSPCSQGSQRGRGGLQKRGWTRGLGRRIPRRRKPALEPTETVLGVKNGGDIRKESGGLVGQASLLVQNGEIVLDVRSPRPRAPGIGQDALQQPDPRRGE